MERLIDQSVQSAKYGNGKIIDVNLDNNEIIIDIQFDRHVKRYSLLKSYETKSIVYQDSALIEELLKKYRPRELPTEPPIDLPIGGPDIIRKPITHWPSTGYNYGDKITELMRNVCYGKTPHATYLRCARSFLWIEAFADEFRPRKLNYAENAAYEYSVWIIKHSNLTHTDAERWHNVIYNDDTIEEEYIYRKKYCRSNDTRIIFVRNEADEYIFAGIYAEINEYINENGNNVVVYKLINDKYIPTRH